MYDMIPIDYSTRLSSTISITQTYTLGACANPLIWDYAVFGTYDADAITIYQI